MQLAFVASFGQKRREGIAETTTNSDTDLTTLPPCETDTGRLKDEAVGKGQSGKGEVSVGDLGHYKNRNSSGCNNPTGLCQTSLRLPMAAPQSGRCQECGSPNLTEIDGRLVCDDCEACGIRREIRNGVIGGGR